MHKKIILKKIIIIIVLRSASHKGCGYNFLCIYQSRHTETRDLMNVASMLNSLSNVQACSTNNQISYDCLIIM